MGRHSRWYLALFVVAVLTGWQAAVVAGQVQPPGTNDYGGTFRSVLIPGQGEGLNAIETAVVTGAGQAPASLSNQLPLFTGLLYAAPSLTRADIDQFYKPEAFGVPDEEVVRTYSPPGRADVRVLRDGFNVPHVYAPTSEAAAFAAGYVQAEDRLFQLDIIRHAGMARLGEFLGPAFVEMDAETLKHSDYSDAELDRMWDELRNFGAEGVRVQDHLNAWLAGVNAYIAEVRANPTELPGEYAAVGKLPEPATRRHLVAAVAAAGALSSVGVSGLETQLAEIRQRFIRRLGKRIGIRRYRDFFDLDDRETPVTTKTPVRFDNPGRPRRGASAVPDFGSVKDRNPIVQGPGAASSTAAGRRLLSGIAAARKTAPRSNALLVNANRSKSGHPLAVMGPQNGTFVPPLLDFELDLHAPGIDFRGSGLLGLLLTGRGPDFAMSPTFAYTDVIDLFAERLCEPDGSEASLESNHYVYKGQCLPFVSREVRYRTMPSVLSPEPPQDVVIRTERSVHGPIQSRGTVRGRPVAFAEARATLFHEMTTLLFPARLTYGDVTDARSFRDAAMLNTDARNFFYVDDRDAAHVQTGWIPMRARGTNPQLPTWGTGRWDWRGFDADTYDYRKLPASRHAFSVNPRSGYVANWNNKAAPGMRGERADFVWRSVQRVELLETPIRRALRHGGKVDLTDVTRIAALAATTDLRGQEVYPWMRKMLGRVRDAELKPLVDALDGWAEDGSHRRDLDRDNVYEHSAAVALMDAWWPRLIRAMFEPKLGTELVDRLRSFVVFAHTANTEGGSFWPGWYGLVEKDLRAVLGRRVRDPLRHRWCGKGSRARCRALLAASLKAAAAELRASQGDNMGQWKVPATCPEQTPPACDQITFLAIGATTLPPIPGQNRPTYQQVIEVTGHRPR